MRVHALSKCSYSRKSDLQKFKGRFQWWKDPVYVAPVSHPLHIGPDFSVLGGREPRITNYPALKRQQEQEELGKRIVTLLKQVNDAQEIHNQFQKSETNLANEIKKWTPSSKGNQQFN
ncbi:unnamed protein product [Bursaphelenchus xylophilus]|uniref:(pine wood nematode) hypothetical protein n=1 Tax=Bursaphelenchus xylophilus TaxID=6326 RepID=A0A1I7RY53_BURXY|nr:unnamed protein product [Bursaphelenchus xylophilus]CAG9085309.1 unnamed protein product [Bursaphelenchus xylophilus]